MAQLNVESIAIDSVSQDPANVRKHDERNMESIIASLRRFGQQTPIVIDAKGIVRKGNGTLQAAKQLGWTTIDAVTTELSGAEATAYAIADNRTSELSEWDVPALALQLEELQLEMPELALDTGFNADEIKTMIAGASKDDEAGSDGAVDADSIEISEQIAANVALRVSGFGVGGSPVQFSDGSPASGLSFVFVSLGDPGDDVDFSNDGGATFTYTPVPDATGVDVSVTDLRITPTGALQGDSGAGAPNASFDFMTVVQ